MHTAFREIPSSWATMLGLAPSNATRQNAVQVVGAKWGFRNHTLSKGAYSLKSRFQLSDSGEQRRRASKLSDVSFMFDRIHPFKLMSRSKDRRVNSVSFRHSCKSWITYFSVISNIRPCGKRA